MDTSGTLDASPSPIGFIGDLGDPWVAGIADILAAERPVTREHHTGPLPDLAFDADEGLRAIIVHRHSLTSWDAARLERWRASDDGPAPLLVLLISPYVRYEELERWSGLVDAVLSEAIAADVLPGRLARALDGYRRQRPPADTSSCRVEVAGGDGEIGGSLVDALVRAGYSASMADESRVGQEGAIGRVGGPPAVERSLTVWEIPILESEWPRRLAVQTQRNGPVLALAAFADRSVVGLAKESGAAACLELPCDLDDLIDVVDRVVRRSASEWRAASARAEPPHRLPPPRRNPRRHRTLVTPVRWSAGGGPPTIPGPREME